MNWISSRSSSSSNNNNIVKGRYDRELIRRSPPNIMNRRSSSTTEEGRETITMEINNKGRRDFTPIIYGSIGSVLLCFAFWIKKMTTSPTKNILMALVPKGPTDILPDEIIKEELLIRLPVKTLIRFKCVSKVWKDFISDDYFRRRFQSRQHSMGSNTPTGFFCSTKKNFHASTHGYCAANKFVYTSENHVQKEELESFFNSLKTFAFVIAASKGLLLLGYHPKRLYVYDVVSKKHVHLQRHTLPTWDGISLGFKCEERRTNHHLCYKVVLVDIRSKCVYESGGSSYNVETYSSETGTWQKSTIKSRLPFQMQQHSVSKVIGGVFHWHQLHSDSIVSYDADRNGRVVLIEPPLINDSTLYGTIMRQFEGRNDGSLQFISIKDVVINVWILQRSGRRSDIDRDVVLKSNWSLVSSVSLWDIGFDYFHEQKSPRIICADPIDPHIIYLDIADQLYAYDYREGKIVFTLSQTITSETDVFVHFEWPTWPCL